MAQVLQDAFAGTAGQNVYLRAGWAEWGWTASQRNKFVIDPTGLLMQMVGGGSNAYFVGKDTTTLSHAISVTLASVSGAMAGSGGYFAVKLKDPYTNGTACSDTYLRFTVNSTTLMQISGANAGTALTTLTLNSGNTPGGTFPIAAGDTIKGDWNGTTKVVRIYKNGSLIYTSAAGTYDAYTGAGTNAGWLSGIAGYADAIQIDDANAADAITVTSLPKVINRAKGATSRAVTLAGTYSGTVPTGVEYRVTLGGTPIAGFDWQALSSFAAAGGVWSGATDAIPQGGMYGLDVREANNTAITASAATFGVGVVTLDYGQSNITRQPSSTPTTTVTPLAGAYFRPDGGAPSQGNSPVQHFANLLSTALGCPVCVMCQGAGGTSAALLTPGGGSAWTAVEAALTAMGGDLELVYYWQGESDVGMAAATWKGYVTAMFNQLKTLTGRTSAQLGWAMAQLSGNGDTSPNTGPTAVNWQAMRDMQWAWCDEQQGIKAHHSIDLGHVPGDGLHVIPDGYILGRERAVQSIKKWYGLAANDGRGPLPTTARYSGTAVTISVDLNGASSLSASGSPLDAWDVSLDDFATTLPQTTSAVVGAQVVITLAAALAAGLSPKVRHLWGVNPPMTTLAIGSGVPGQSAAVPVAPVSITAIESLAMQLHEFRSNAGKAAALDLGCLLILPSGSVQVAV